MLGFRLDGSSLCRNGTGMRGSLRGSCALAWALLPATALANAPLDAEAQVAVEKAMRAACAVRGLALQRPVQVRPMQQFGGGYTAGVGSVSWEEKYAKTWRDGWCALGIYCATPDDATAAAPAAPGSSPLRGPEGLYDFDKNTLFVRTTKLAASTVAHETVHALQYQNFPHLSAAHPWDNRDLAAATAAAIEGDAHVVGASFDPASRRYWCSMDPRRVDANFMNWRGWRADSFWAHEGFPHVFGPPRLLQLWLDDGNAGANRLLRSPPLSTQAVLKPEATGPVRFIRLPDNLLSSKLRERGCREGLVNTAGVVGIWGLLLHHGDRDAKNENAPELLDAWSGDRFRHIACPGKRGDELAWVTHWRSAAAALEFATRLRGIATAAANYGGVLSTALEPVVYDTTVVATTHGLDDAVSDLARAETQQFANYRAWFASGCFPNAKCYEHTPSAVPKTHRRNAYVCARIPPAEHSFFAWLQRIRQARERLPAASADVHALLAESAELAAFCTLNGVRNSDLAQACRAVVVGIAHWSTWQRDSHWQRLPHCADASELRGWLHTTYHADAQRPFASTATFAGIYGPALAARTFANRGIAGLRELLANPPLATRRYLPPASADLPPADVDAVSFLRFPAETLATHGCTVASSDVLGALSIWALLLDYGELSNDRTPPDWLRHWRGDRRAYIRCADSEGWIWASHWQSEAAAEAFANHYATLDGHAAETELPARRVDVRAQTAWLVPAALKPIAAALADGLEIKPFSSFQEWTTSGCFPQSACNQTAR